MESNPVQPDALGQGRDHQRRRRRADLATILTRTREPQKRRSAAGLLACAFLMLVSACVTGTNPGQSGLHVRVVADGRERAFVIPQANSVGQFLTAESITLGEFDKVYPSTFDPVTDNLTITIIRVTQTQDCQPQDVPYTTVTQNTMDLKPGETKVLQGGVNGQQTVCYNVVSEDGVEKSRTQGLSTTVSTPIPEILARGVDLNAIEPIAIGGQILYLSGNQAHLIDGNSIRQRTLATGGNLDGRVFALSTDGKALLFTRKPGQSSLLEPTQNLTTPTPVPTGDHFNELWVMFNLSNQNAQPFKLLDDVLDAEWVPGQPNTISYSTGSPQGKFPFYTAFNDLIVATIDPIQGQLIKASKVVSVGPGGAYSWWGTAYRWSPDGTALAWVQADSIGTVDLKTGKLATLLNFPVYSTTLPLGWVWTPNLNWSPNGNLVVADVHSTDPSAATNAPADTSPAFDVAAAAPSGAYAVPIVPMAGMWARPQFSILDANGNGYLAYLRARDPQNSLNSDYDLVVANRDGANANAIFPGADKPGLRPIDDLGTDFIWGPSGGQIVAVYQGNLWLIDIPGGTAHQITVIGGASLPRWARTP